MPEVRSPTVRRRELGLRLRALRNEKGLTVEEVAELLLCSPSKVSRMETGHGIATARDIRDLCNLYGVTEETERDRLRQLASEGKQQGWWQPYELTYGPYIDLEAEALAIRDFQSSVVPGLLQTADYARAGHEAYIPRLSSDQIELNIEAKLKRQGLLTRPDPPTFSAVLDEAVLQRVVGGPRVMGAQLDRLIEASRLPNVTVQVIPFAIGYHPGLESNFRILDLPASAPSVVFVEGLVGSVYLERQEDLKRYREVFKRLQTVALSPKDTINAIMRIKAQFGDVNGRAG